MNNSLKLPTVVQGKDNKSVFITSSLHSEGSFLVHPPPRKWKTLTFFPEFRSELTQNTPQMKNSNFLSWVQIWAYTEHPPKMKNSNFLSWVQIWANTEHPPSPEMKNSNFLSWVQIWAYTDTPSVVVEVCGDCIPQEYHLVSFFCHTRAEYVGMSMNITQYSSCCCNLWLVWNNQGTMIQLLWHLIGLSKGGLMYIWSVVS